MSINTLMTLHSIDQQRLSGELPFSLMESEMLKYTSSSSRQSIEIYLTKPGGRTVNIKTKDGNIYLTNKRFVYITKSLGDINNFVFEFSQWKQSHFSHELVAPWFGANYWRFMFLGVDSSGGLLEGQQFEGKLKFYDGGIFDFVKIFEEILNNYMFNQDIDEELPPYTPGDS